MTSKIDGYGQTAGVSLPSALPRTTASDKPRVGAVAASDSLVLSERMVDMQAVQRKAGEATIGDPQKIERLRAAVESGNYPIDARTIATRLLDVEKALK